MKTLKSICTFAILAITTIGFAQTLPPAPPARPAPPAKPVKVYEDASTTVTTNSSNVSVITQSGSKGGNISFSVSSSNDTYQLKSKFPNRCYLEVKDFLLQEMGTKNMQSSGASIVWSLEGDEDTVYEIQLQQRKLHIELDKTIASPELISKFDDMGEILRTLISGESEQQEISRLERQADRAQREAQRMQREAERLQAMSIRESERLALEAERLSREAYRLSLISKRGGGVDGYVKEVLDHQSTAYPSSITNTAGWRWPAFQEALLNKLLKDNFLKKGDELVFVKEEQGMYVNGKKLSPSSWSSYNSLFRKYEYASIDDVTFYKKGNHIAVVNGAFNLEDLLNTIVNRGLLKNTKSPVRVEVNGYSVVVDGKKLSNTDTARWNAILHSNAVIPAPGKTLIIGSDFISLGYSLGRNTLGLWMSLD